MIRTLGHTAIATILVVASFSLAAAQGGGGGGAGGGGASGGGAGTSGGAAGTGSSGAAMRNGAARSSDPSSPDREATTGTPAPIANGRSYISNRYGYDPGPPRRNALQGTYDYTYPPFATLRRGSRHYRMYLRRAYYVADYHFPRACDSVRFPRSPVCPVGASYWHPTYADHWGYR